MAKDGTGFCLVLLRDSPIALFASAGEDGVLFYARLI